MEEPLNPAPTVFQSFGFGSFYVFDQPRNTLTELYMDNKISNRIMATVKILMKLTFLSFLTFFIVDGNSSVE
jgi:hypothetical protein